MISSKQIRKRITNAAPGSLNVILDPEYREVSDGEIQGDMNCFIKHRAFFKSLKNALKANPNLSIEDVIKVVFDNYGIEKAFEYKENVNDCDNSAIGFLDWMSGEGKAVGVAINTEHTLIVHFNGSGALAYDEPQTGKINVDYGEPKVVVMV